jgi:arylsulfatase A-like enzyme
VRRPTWCVLGAMCVAALPAVRGVVLADEAAKAKRPNLLFLFSDDQRYDTIHALGNPIIQTPNLDRLVGSGFVFTNNYVMGSMSGAVCYPSRAMLQSGRTLWHVPGNLQGVPIWPEVMRRAGYATFGTGKWHNGPASFARGFTHGGAIFFGGMSDHYRVPIYDFDPTGKYPAGKRYIGGKFSSALFADAAIDFLKRHRGDQPFFMYVSFTAPHDPRRPPPPYDTLYDPRKIPTPKSFMPRHPFDNGELVIRDEKLAPFPRTPEIIKRHIAQYYGMITHLDAQIGRILEALKVSGHADDTIILFSSDNGLALGRHGLLGKQNLYEHSSRMPLIFAGPGIPHGRSDALVYLYDLFPTACDLTGLTIPRGVEGKSLLPIIRGEKQQVRDFVLTAYKDVQRAVREPRWKLIEYHVGGVKTRQLFDLENDPEELKNLAGDPAAAEPLRRLEALLNKARAEADDPIDFERVGGKPSGK